MRKRKIWELADSDWEQKNSLTYVAWGNSRLKQLSTVWDKIIQLFFLTSSFNEFNGAGSAVDGVTSPGC